MDDAKAVIDAARKENSGERSQNEYLIALNRAKRERERLFEAKFRLYENLEKGIIDQDEYTQFKERYREEIAEQESQIKRLQDNLTQLKEARKQDDAFVTFFKEFGNIKTIDRNTLNRLLDHIEVTDAQHLDIYFKFSAERQRILRFAKSIEDEAEDETMC